VQGRIQNFCVGGRGCYGERGARAYNGGLGAEPPAGSRGRAPGGGPRGRRPPEAESFSVFRRQKEAANLALSCVLGTWTGTMHLVKRLVRTKVLQR